MPPLHKYISFILLLSCSLRGLASSVPADKDEKSVIPPDLYFEFKSIPVAENAIINWRQAGTLEVEPGPAVSRLLAYCWTPGAREPSAADLDQLKAWLERNQDALKIYDAGLKKTAAQWPEREIGKPQPELKALQCMTLARLFEADQLAENHEYREATDSLEETLQATQRAVEGDALRNQYLIATLCRGFTQDAMLRLASREEIPVSMIQELLAKMPGLSNETNIFAGVLANEFTRTYDATIDIHKLLAGYSQLVRTNPRTLLLFPEAARRPLQVLLDPSLVAIHPKPLDMNFETEETIRHYRIYRTNACSAWTNRDGEVEQEKMKNEFELLDEIDPIMEAVNNEPLPLNQKAVQKIRTAYLKLNNPAGRILDCSLVSTAGSDLRVFEGRTEREATRAFLALVIFERQRGHLPASLSEVVQAKILSSLPVDGFNGQPLNYSHDLRKIWSVSGNGIDDGGEGGATRWEGEDAVWQIPELN